MTTLLLAAAFYLYGVVAAWLLIDRVTRGLGEEWLEEGYTLARFKGHFAWLWPVSVPGLALSIVRASRRRR